MVQLPRNYIEWLSERVRPEVVQRFAAGLQEPSPVSIRMNPAMLPADAEPDGAVGRVPWCPEGVYLQSRPTFTADPLLHAGAYYVQEASSMFLAYALRQLHADSEGTYRSALDLCAAPGGKTTLMRAVLPDSCTLVANEALPKRADILAENIAKWRAQNTICTNAQAEELGRMQGVFDLIVADVPCSGEGMFRKEPDAVEGWSIEAVERLAELQRSIIADIWPALADGGTLIYSTCTLNPLEDEANVHWIASQLGADIVRLSVPAQWGIIGDATPSAAAATAETDMLSLDCCHLLPGYVQGEGFFLAVLRKHGQSDITVAIESLTKAKSSKSSNRAKGRERTDSHHSKPQRTPYAQQAARPALPPLLAAVAARVRTLPTDTLQVSTGTPLVEVSLTDALRYLQRESIALPADTPRGTVQLCYQGRQLGPAKNLGNRANNLYPKEWRIRSQHIEAHTLFALPESCTAVQHTLQHGATTAAPRSK